MSGIESALAALYLRGIPRPTEPNPRKWPGIVSLLRKQSLQSHPGDYASPLRSAGYASEAAVLESRAVDQAVRVIESGLALTVASCAYPRRWVERLGQAAPPALYSRGSFSLLEPDCVAIVGSRHPPAAAWRTSSAVALGAKELGFTIVSGGAPGIDRSISAVGSFIEIWPCGLGVRWGTPNRQGLPTLQLSLWPPREPFSTAGAMERNTLVYAIAEAAFVGHARFRQGGSWHGATDALRRRLTRILVTEAEWAKPAEAARRALLGLGATSLSGSSASEIELAMSKPSAQPWLPAFAPDVFTERALGAY